MNILLFIENKQDNAKKYEVLEYNEKDNAKFVAE